MQKYRLWIVGSVVALSLSIGLVSAVRIYTSYTKEALKAELFARALNGMDSTAVYRALQDAGAQRISDDLAGQLAFDMEKAVESDQDATFGYSGFLMIRVYSQKGVVVELESKKLEFK